MGGKFTQVHPTVPPDKNLSPFSSCLRSPALRPHGRRFFKTIPGTPRAPAAAPACGDRASGSRPRPLRHEGRNPKRFGNTLQGRHISQAHSCQNAADLSLKIDASGRAAARFGDLKGFESPKSSHFSFAMQNRLAAPHNGKCRYVP
jgi:hypothetical protein